MKTRRDFLADAGKAALATALAAAAGIAAATQPNPLHAKLTAYLAELFRQHWIWPINGPLPPNYLPVEALLEFDSIDLSTFKPLSPSGKPGFFTEIAGRIMPYDAVCLGEYRGMSLLVPFRAMKALEFDPKTRVMSLPEKLPPSESFAGIGMEVRHQVEHLVAEFFGRTGFIPAPALWRDDNDHPSDWVRFSSDTWCLERPTAKCDDLLLADDPIYGRLAAQLCYWAPPR